MAKEKQKTINIKNRKAEFDYYLMEKYTAGLVLTGTEIKSIRLGKASLVDTYCVIIQGEVWVKNMNIAQYFYGTYNNHAARRDRKLLLNRREIHRLQQARLRQARDPQRKGGPPRHQPTIQAQLLACPKVPLSG